MQNYLRFIGQTMVLSGLYVAGNTLTQFLPVPLPGNVTGMLLLFGLLTLGWLKLEQVEVAGGWLLRHISFFFIPIAVGLLKWTDLFWQYSWQLLLVVGGSGLLCLAVTGGLAQYLTRKEG